MYAIQILVFTDHVVLAHSHFHSYNLWLLSHCNDRVATETLWIAKLKIFAPWLFTTKVADPGAKGSQGDF